MSNVARKRNVILEAIARFKAIAPGMTLNEVMAFLYIAENPGINIGELAELCGLQPSSTSRVVATLSSAEDGRATTRQLGLIVMVPNPFDSRVRFLALSKTGEALCRNLDAVIGHAVPIASKSDAFIHSLKDLSAMAEDVAEKA